MRGVGVSSTVVSVLFLRDCIWFYLRPNRPPTVLILRSVVLLCSDKFGHGGFRPFSSSFHQATEKRTDAAA